MVGDSFFSTDRLSNVRVQQGTFFGAVSDAATSAWSVKVGLLMCAVEVSVPCPDDCVRGTPGQEHLQVGGVGVADEKREVL